MNLNEWLRLIAGAFVLSAVVLGATVHLYWNYFAAFVAANLTHRRGPVPGAPAAPDSRRDRPRD